MKRYTKKRSKKAWMAPGTLVHIGEKTVDITGITVIDYSETELREETLNKIEECFLLKGLDGARHARAHRGKDRGHHRDHGH